MLLALALGRQASSRQRQVAMLMLRSLLRSADERLASTLYTQMLAGCCASRRYRGGGLGSWQLKEKLQLQLPGRKEVAG